MGTIVIAAELQAKIDATNTMSADQLLEVLRDYRGSPLAVQERAAMNIAIKFPESIVDALRFAYREELKEILRDPRNYRPAQECW